MFLIVGLGNPGLQYSHTRHNVGFLCADRIAFYLGFPTFKEKFESLITERNFDANKIIIQKPQTYMNLSGKSVMQITSFYKIHSEDIVVIHDDIDLDPFDVRIKFSGGHGGHNGLRNIDESIGKNYWRIRIGVGRPPSKLEVSNYVLSNFYPDELTKLQSIFDIISKHIASFMLSSDKQKESQDITSSIKEYIKSI